MLVVLSTVMEALAGVALAVMARIDWGGLVGLAGPLFVVSATGFAIANSIAGALDSFPRHLTT